MGKSSLRVRTARRLAERGVRCVSVDLTAIGSGAGPDPVEQWYLSFLSRVCRQLNLPEPRAFWQSHGGLTPVSRMETYLRTLVADPIPAPIAIFIDELDVVRGLGPGRDDFFAAIRSLHDLRADQPSLERLAICILGVGTPSSLMTDPTRTPFNIGVDIRLVDFDRPQIEAFGQTIAPRVGAPSRWLDEIHHWTEGHPCMTQKLCLDLQRLDAPGDPAETVRRLVEARFLSRGGEMDNSLAYIENAFLDPGAMNERACPRLGEMIRLYRRLLAGEIIPADDNDVVQTELRLSGLAATRDAGGRPRLRIRNPIIRAVFDDRWAAAKQARRFIGEPFRLWVESGGNPRFFLTGDTLREAHEHAKTIPEITAAESHFLATSWKHTLEEEQRICLAEQWIRRGREERIRRRLGIGVIAATALCVALLFTQWLHDHSSRDKRRSRERRALAWALGEPRTNPAVLLAAIAITEGMDAGAKARILSEALKIPMPNEDSQLAGDVPDRDPALRIACDRLFDPSGAPLPVLQRHAVSDNEMTEDIEAARDVCRRFRARADRPR